MIYLHLMFEIKRQISDIIENCAIHHRPPFRCDSTNPIWWWCRPFTRHHCLTTTIKHRSIRNWTNQHHGAFWTSQNVFYSRAKAPVVVVVPSLIPTLIMCLLLRVSFLLKNYYNTLFEKGSYDKNATLEFVLPDVAPQNSGGGAAPSSSSKSGTTTTTVHHHHGIGIDNAVYHDSSAESDQIWNNQIFKTNF